MFNTLSLYYHIPINSSYISQKVISVIPTKQHERGARSLVYENTRIVSVEIWIYIYSVSRLWVNTIFRTIYRKLYIYMFTWYNTPKRHPNSSIRPSSSHKCCARSETDPPSHWLRTDRHQRGLVKAEEGARNGYRQVGQSGLICLFETLLWCGVSREGYLILREIKYAINLLKC